MPKIINLKLYKDNKLEKEYQNIKAISNKDLNFIIDDAHMLISENLLTRENKEYKFTIDFNKKEAIYHLKEMNNTFVINVESCSINRTNNKIVIKYKIETEEQEIKIEIESND